MAGSLVAIFWICGCGRPFGVPAGASVCGEGVHPGCVPPRAGNVWVYDKSANRIVFQGSVIADQDLSVDPAGNQITLDGNPVQSETLTKGHQYQIYFEPTRSGG